MKFHFSASATRYAPSPTGPLHLGHVAHLVWVWGVARACGAAVLLRFEDHDRGRCRVEYERSIVEDLAWLGFEPDNCIDAVSPYRQSDNEAAYREALERMADRAYFCDCTRKQIAERCPLGPGGERVYDGRCRDRGLDRGGVRVRMEPGVERFRDLRLGERAQDPAAQAGDLLVRDRNGQWTYQFAVVVDDLRQGIDLVVRGEDLLESTGRQIRLGRLLGRVEPPRFLHHPLIVDERGVKLSKRTAAGPIAAERAAGRRPEDVIGEAAARVGLTDRAGPLGPEEALARVAEVL